MIARAEPWQTAEVSGLTRAVPVIKPEVVIAAIKKSKRPILIVGHEAASMELEQGKPIDYVIQIAELTGAQIVATAHVIGEFTQRGFNRASWMPIMDISNRLRDPDWQGLDGQGQYDLVLLIGFQYYLEWITLSGFKHFAPHLKTISLGRYHQPHANWSFPNVTPVDWERQLKSIVKQLKEK